MKEVLTDVLKAESDAEQALREAREKRDQEKSRLEAEISEMLKEAKTQAQQVIREAVQKARSDASKEQEQAIHQAAEDAEKFALNNNDKIRSIIEEVCGLILTPDLPG